MRKSSSHLLSGIVAILAFSSLVSIPLAFAQSPEVSAEWALFNQILIIGIGVGLVVFGIMFYAIIRYREKPQRSSAT